MPRYQDFPLDDIVLSIIDRSKDGWFCYQKWTCSHCGARQTMPTPNKVYERGICDECKKETNIRARGCNFMASTVPINI